MPQRTTVTLDDDVARKLDEESRKTGEPFRKVLNDALRRGLNPPRPAGTKKFKVRPRPLGLRAGYSVDSIEELLDQAEGAARK